MEPDLAATPTRGPDMPEAAVAAIIQTPVTVPKVVEAAASMINTLAPEAVGVTPREIANSGTNPAPIMAATRARKASRWMNALHMTINRYPHVQDPAY